MSLRISFMELMIHETFQLPKKKQAFKIVTNNIINYLKIKNEVSSNTSFGLNL